MKIKETATRPALYGFGWSRQSRVIALPDGSPTPDGADIVPEDTPLSDWQTDAPADAASVVKE